MTNLMLCTFGCLHYRLRAQKKIKLYASSTVSSLSNTPCCMLLLISKIFSIFQSINWQTWERALQAGSLESASRQSSSATPSRATSYSDGAPYSTGGLCLWISSETVGLGSGRQSNCWTGKRRAGQLYAGPIVAHIWLSMFEATRVSRYSEDTFLSIWPRGSIPQKKS